ncbi:MAG: UDP-N-acetylglucosamine--N-acetylmuramyl-(pentapeptide) pyrophosphoryl-undecaprenol N-acetylglucosamine transferase [Chloroflexi bacterium]|nr:UDP-N-acetylglucosamine--N-acetylmuramyl-(pentapeptide) pyrophosphoryl-undecaprenol N-acetylglucosamine transferase [Chloroflexota bacterium]
MLNGANKTPATVRVWIAGGGTGGHVYPGLATVQALAADSLYSTQNGRLELLYVGGEGGIEEGLAQRASLPFVGVPGGGIHGLSLRQIIRNIGRLARGTVAVYRLARNERPSALFVTGGYASVPVAVGCWMRRVPILLYLPDIEPGWAVRFIAVLAKRIAVTVEESCKYFPSRKVVVTGYPVRAEFAEVHRARARKALGLQSDSPVLLVLGGSRGARPLNQALLNNVNRVLELAQVVHVSGELDWPDVAKFRESLVTEQKSRYHAFPYMHDIGLAMASADLILCRSGASTLGELPYFGLPAILVPYSHAWRYQQVTAGWLAERGAACMMSEDRLMDDLVHVLERLFSDPGALSEMSGQMRALARPEAASSLARELIGLAYRQAEGRALAQ